jgi:rubredoxin
MKIIRISERNRRDFWADYECEHCGLVHKNMSGYDDTNFHNNVIPKMKCPSCKKVAKDYVPRSPKYDASTTI